MTLLDDLPKLREMEQEIAVFKQRRSMPTEDIDRWDECDYAIISAAPAMIDVLECFREGDAARLERMATRIEERGGLDGISPGNNFDAAAVRRMQRAASLMEGKGDDRT